MFLALVPIVACNGDDSGDDDAADSAADDETPASDDFAPGDDDSSGAGTGGSNSAGSNSGGSEGDSTGAASADGSTDAGGTGGGACVEAGQPCGPNDYCNTWLCGCLNSETEFMTIGVCDAGMCEEFGTLACTPICEPNGGISSVVDGGCG